MSMQRIEDFYFGGGGGGSRGFKLILEKWCFARGVSPEKIVKKMVRFGVYFATILFSLPSPLSLSSPLPVPPSPLLSHSSPLPMPSLSPFSPLLPSLSPLDLLSLSPLSISPLPSLSLLPLL